jgi:3-hydroxybutyryl-CoA dehydrogenase
VRAADTPGFIVNHAGRGFGTEALRILQEGVASFDTIDRVLREAAGFRMGPFELMDLTGVDVSHPVMESIYDQFYQEPRFRPSYLLRQRYVAGLFGRKVGRGFYSYRDGKPVAVPEPTAPEGKPMPVWIDAAEVGWRDALRGVVKAAGWKLEEGERPGTDALCLVAPLGDDATTAAQSRGLDSRRTIAVDMLFGLKGRRSVMTTPVTLSECVASACTLLKADGTPVSRLRDSPGFVAQRVAAMIVNIGCDIAQQGIASPEDIDNAVQLGLGYPKGPLALGDALGPARILAILDSLSAYTRDPRYRPCPWLIRRARLGISLRTAEQ